MSPARVAVSLLRGAVAGVVGTVAMDLLWYRRYRKRGGTTSFTDWEFRTQPASWEAAPAPAQVGRTLIRAATGNDVSVERAGTVTAAMHWGYGTSWGAAYSVARAVTGVPPGPLAGAAFGTLVFGSDYVTLPLLEVYKPIWEYEPRVLRDDLTAHLVFGLATTAAMRLLGAGCSGTSADGGTG